MTLLLDHVVVVVPVLDQAIRDFEAGGFVVVPGGEHDAIPTANALIAFEDGAYLELLALRDGEARASLELRRSRPGWEADLRRGSAVGRRFLPLLAGAPGVADFVLRASPLARLAGELRRRGVALTGPVPMARERRDGTRIAWELALPEATRHPMLIEDRTPRTLRVPGDPASTTHRNRARGVATVRMRVLDLASAALEYADFFAGRPRALPDGTTRIGGFGFDLVLETGTPEGAHAVGIAGAGPLPEAIRNLGVRAAGD